MTSPNEDTKMFLYPYWGDTDTSSTRVIGYICFNPILSVLFCMVNICLPSQYKHNVPPNFSFWWFVGPNFVQYSVKGSPRTRHCSSSLSGMPLLATRKRNIYQSFLCQMGAFTRKPQFTTAPIEARDPIQCLPSWCHGSHQWLALSDAWRPLRQWCCMYYQCVNRNAIPFYICFLCPCLKKWLV